MASSAPAVPRNPAIWHVEEGDKPEFPGVVFTDAIISNTPVSVRIGTGEGNEYRFDAIEKAGEFYDCISLIRFISISPRFPEIICVVIGKSTVVNLHMTTTAEGCHILYRIFSTLIPWDDVMRF